MHGQAEKIRLLFATQNRYKIKEVKILLPEQIELVTLNELNFHDELPETANTLQENARQKARFIHDIFRCNCFAEDTGLEVEALGGAPGVYSARYAGLQKNEADNIALLLDRLHGIEQREACFRTMITLIWNGQEYCFEGVTRGTIALAPRGDQGFGYDPVFIPHGYKQTFAELNIQEKNKISHRAQAFVQMSNFLTKMLRM